MRPSVDIYLDELRRALAQDFAPQLATSFEQSALGRHAVLLGAVTEEFDRDVKDERDRLWGLFDDPAHPQRVEAVIAAAAAPAVVSESVSLGDDVSSADDALHRKFSILHGLYPTVAASAVCVCAL